MDIPIIDLEQKSKELKSYVSQFETSLFLGDLSSQMRFISFEKPLDSLKGFSSPMRQFFYLAGLNLTSKIDASTPLKSRYTNEEWEHIKRLVLEIEMGYQQIFYNTKQLKEFGTDRLDQLRVSMLTFFTYFDQGPLVYEEQVIERISVYFTLKNHLLGRW
jgi:hypothetical protein